MAKAKRSICREIVEGLREIKRGQVGRVINAPDVWSIREKIELSQARFDRLLSVSAHTLRDWELGRSAPSGAPRTLLTEGRAKYGLGPRGAGRPRALLASICVLLTPYAGNALAEETQKSVAAASEATAVVITVLRSKGVGAGLKSIRITDATTSRSVSLAVERSFLTVERIPAGQYYVSQARDWAIDAPVLKFDRPERLFIVVAGTTTYIGDIFVEMSRKERTISVRHEVNPDTLKMYGRKRPDLFPEGTVVVSTPGVAPVVVAIPK